MTQTIDIARIWAVLGLSQEALAERLGGLSQSTISRLERGETKPKGLVLKALLEMAAAVASEEEVA